MESELGLAKKKFPMRMFSESVTEGSSSASSSSITGREQTSQPAGQETQHPTVGTITEGIENAEEPVAVEQLTNMATLESLCVHCGKNGVTRFLLLHIPHFKETVVSAFECASCGHTNNEITSARSLNDFGIKYSLQVASRDDLNRQVVRSEYASLAIPEIELEMPSACSISHDSLNFPHSDANPKTKSLLTTVEGLIMNIIDDLSLEQPERQASNPDVHEKIQAVIDRLKSMLTLDLLFIVNLDDPSGNSYIEERLTSSPSHLPLRDSRLTAQQLDPQLREERYDRTFEQLKAMGFAQGEREDPSKEDQLDHNEQTADGQGENEVYEFLGTCPSCQRPSMTRMHPIEIPYFKQVIIMATVCDFCGYKSNEVKSGSAMSEKGRKIILRLQTAEDLSRDILKSETCRVEIPEIKLELHQGTLGGRFTTVEGLLTQVKEELEERVPFSLGDSATPEKKQIFHELISNLDRICQGDLPCTIIIDDPLANSYLQSLTAPLPDPQITFEEYERTHEQNEDLGINDMMVDMDELQPS